MNLNIAAVYDVLTLLNLSPSQLDGLSVDELHLFCYSACVLSLFKAHLVSDWQYTFCSTTHDVPFAMDITSALNWLQAKALVSIDSKLSKVKITDNGRNFLHKIHGHGQWSWRGEFLESLSYLTARYPVNVVSQALNHDPLVELTAKHRSEIFDDTNIRLLRRDFSTLRETLGDGRAGHMAVVAALWVQALDASRDKESR